MAKYKGLIEITGAVGDLVFYELNGRQVVRRKSGFSGESFKNDPKYAKVRENSSEFGNASKAGKMLRTLLAEYLKFADDKYLYQKFAKLMTQLKDLDLVSARGGRKISEGLKHPLAQELLRSFMFGNVANWEDSAMRTGGLFTEAITISNQQNYDSLGLITIKPDFTLNTAEKAEQFLATAGKKNLYEFERFFVEEDPTTLLYFLVAKKNDAIVRMGFV